MRLLGAFHHVQFGSGLGQGMGIILEIWRNAYIPIGTESRPSSKPMVKVDASASKNAVRFASSGLCFIGCLPLRGSPPREQPLRLCVAQL